MKNRMLIYMKTMSIIYAAISGFFIYFIVNYLIFAFTRINVTDEQIGIIGGADIPTLKFLFGKYLFPIVFIVSLIVSNVINLLFSFKKNKSNKMKWVIFGWIILNLFLFILIPPQFYTVSLYLTLKSNWLFKIISPLNVFALASVLLSVSLLIKERKETK